MSLGIFASPGRYVQGRNATEQLGEQLLACGLKVGARRASRGERARRRALAAGAAVVPHRAVSASS